MRIGPEMHKASRTRSVSGVRWLGVPYISYAATKAAVIQLTASSLYSMSGRGSVRTRSCGNDEYAYGPRARCHRRLRRQRRRDGPPPCEQCPMGRMGDAWDVANAALFLASEEAKYIGECEPGSVAPFEQCATVSPTPVQAIGKWSAPGYAVCGCDRSIKTP